MRIVHSGLLVLVASCGSMGRVNVPNVDGGGIGGSAGVAGFSGAGGGAGSGGASGGSGGMVVCTPLPIPDDAGAVMHPDFAARYSYADLGPVPGVPDPLGGCVILQSDRNHMLIAGDSERPTGALYRIALRRNACGHIVGFDGVATKVADTPYIDANILELPGGSLLYTGWPVHQLSQLKIGQTSPLWTIDIRDAGFQGSSPGGLARVPSNLGGPGRYRVVGYPDGLVHDVLYRADDAGVYAVTGFRDAGVIANGPGGFSYVPEGSPLFPRPSIINADWITGQVSTVEVDSQGNPLPATRRLVFSAFPRPWGSYFEPETGDFLFMTWRNMPGPDRVFIVTGFERPPEIQ